MTDPVFDEPTQDSKNTAALVWVGAFFTAFLIPAIVFVMKKDDDFVQDQSKEAINWAITAFLAYLAGFILTFILIGLLVILAVAITHVVVCIMGALNASKGIRYRAPFAVRLLK